VSHVVPPAMYVKNKPGIAMRIGCGRWRHPIGRSTDQPNENLTLGRRETCCSFNNCVQRSVAELNEMVRFPIIACPTRHPTIKRLPPGGITPTPDVRPVKAAKTTDRRATLIPLSAITCIESRRYDYFFSMHTLRKERQRRGLTEDDSDSEFLR